MQLHPFQHADQPSGEGLGVETVHGSGLAQSRHVRDDNPMVFGEALQNWGPHHATAFDAAVE
jgi:hypothetical protein